METDIQPERIRYQLTEIETTNPTTVGRLVGSLFLEMFPDDDDSDVKQYFGVVEDMFQGQYAGFLPMDTAYHDLEHTMQATLCLVRLLNNRHFAGAEPVITPKEFRLGLLAILLHDVGYLKLADDVEGTGAKYTHVHEERSCVHARVFLQHLSWPSESITKVEHLIRSTGPGANIDAIPFADATEAMLARVVATADFIGQMSDPRYVEKLPTLYREFEENYDFREFPDDQRAFASFEDLLHKTPAFYERFVKPRMENEYHNVWQFFKDPITGEDIYRTATEANIQRIRDQLAQMATDG